MFCKKDRKKIRIIVITLLTITVIASLAFGLGYGLYSKKIKDKLNILELTANQNYSCKLLLNNGVSWGDPTGTSAASEAARYCGAAENSTACGDLVLPLKNNEIGQGFCEWSPTCPSNSTLVGKQSLNANATPTCQCNPAYFSTEGGDSCAPWTQWIGEYDTSDPDQVGKTEHMKFWRYFTEPCIVGKHCETACCNNECHGANFNSSSLIPNLVRNKCISQQDATNLELVGAGMTSSLCERGGAGSCYCTELRYDPMCADFDSIECDDGNPLWPQSLVCTKWRGGQTKPPGEKPGPVNDVTYDPGCHAGLAPFCTSKDGSYIPTCWDTKTEGDCNSHTSCKWIANPDDTEWCNAQGYGSGGQAAPSSTDIAADVIEHALEWGMWAIGVTFSTYWNVRV